jgi:hypothetical protein
MFHTDPYQNIWLRECIMCCKFFLKHSYCHRGLRHQHKLARCTWTTAGDKSFDLPPAGPLCPWWAMVTRWQPEQRARFRPRQHWFYHVPIFCKLTTKIEESFEGGDTWGRQRWRFSSTVFVPSDPLSPSDPSLAACARCIFTLVCLLLLLPLCFVSLCPMHLYIGWPTFTFTSLFRFSAVFIF